MGTLLPFLRPIRVALAASSSSGLAYPRLARENARPSLPLRPVLTSRDDHLFP